MSRVNHPKYYNNGPVIKLKKDYKKGDILRIECIDVIREMPLWKGNIFKYLWRCGEKEEEGLSLAEKELEDMQKASWYLDDKINQTINIMETYVLVYWPESQNLMAEEDFEEHSCLADAEKFGPQAYFVEKKWYSENR